MPKIVHVALISVIAIAGCTSKNLTASVISFDDSVAKAVELHNKQLDRVVKIHDSALREALAQDPAKLTTTGCDLLLIDYSPELAAGCVVERIKDGKAEPIDANPVRIDRLNALAEALANYSSALRLLVADTKNDRKAFNDALASIATNIGGLQGQVERAGGSAVVDQKSLGVIAGLAAEAGSLYFEQRRSRVLRATISAAHPLVIGATEILEGAGQNARTALLSQTAAKDLDKAERDLHALLLGAPSAAKVRTAQDKLFKAHREYLAAASVMSSFGRVREAHEAMMNAAQSGLSADDLIVLAEKLTVLAGRVEATIAVLEN